MEMISYIGLFDELEKIAEEQRKDIPKGGFKRHLKAVAAIGAGMGVGAGLGGLAKRELLKNKGKIGDFLKKHPTAMKAAPLAVGALLAGGAGLGMHRTKMHFRHVEKGDDRPN